ncbi:MAG: peptide deformylase [Roseobacter sp.]|jgi:peptide deformylase|nr:peptide deformylase [Roseobacter sp.]
MSLREILQWPDSRLQAVCTPVGDITPEIESLAADMLETMYAAPGRGLAAPQVGVLRRLFVMDVAWKEGARYPQVFVDPQIVGESRAAVSGDEACLSIPGVTACVVRPEWVEVKWRDLEGRPHHRRLEGIEARCAQHELDHLNGVVTLDRLDAGARAAAMADYPQAAP